MEKTEHMHLRLFFPVIAYLELIQEINSECQMGYSAL